MRRLRGSLLLLFASGIAGASSLKARDLSERTREADRVVLAEVLGSEVQVPGNDVRRMTTVTSIQVLEDYKGSGPRELEVVQLGGQSGLWQLKVSGAVEWVPGETAVLFLSCRDPAQPARCTVSGLSEGKVPVVGRIGAQDALVPGVDRRGPVRLRLEELADRIRRALPRGGR